MFYCWLLPVEHIAIITFHLFIIVPSHFHSASIDVCFIIMLDDSMLADVFDECWQ